MVAYTLKLAVGVVLLAAALTAVRAAPGDPIVPPGCEYCQDRGIHFDNTANKTLPAVGQLWIYNCEEAHAVARRGSAGL
jgi:hypothetical protein